MIVTVLNHSMSTPAPAPTAVIFQTAAGLKAANTAAAQAEDILRQLGRLQAIPQPQDVFTLKGLEAQAQTALSQANGILPDGQPPVFAAAYNAGFLAQSALQNIAQRWSLASEPPVVFAPPVGCQTLNTLNLVA